MSRTHEQPKDAHADHGHGGHSHAHGHSHAPSPDADRRYLGGALALLGLFLIAEVVLGLKAGSLALLTDAGHMLTDIAAIALALYAMSLAARPAKGGYTFGFKRAEILSALANGVTLLVLGGWFLFEAIHRLFDPPEVEGGIVLAVAIVGVVVNLIATWLMSKADRRSLNVEGAYQHVLTDLYAFIGTAIAGVIVITTGWVRADSIAAFVVAVLMLRSGGQLLKNSSRVLLEAAPLGIEPAEVSSSMSAVPGVADVHDLHVWEVTSGFAALSAHVLVNEERDCHQVRVDVQRALAERFHIDHTTLQVDHVNEHAAGAQSSTECCVDEHVPAEARQR